MFRSATATVLIWATAFTPAWAGMTLDPVKPQVSINRGEGFKPVTTPTSVSSGDRVMAGPGGHGKIVYADGCVVDVYPGNVLTVPGKCYQPMTAGLEAPPPAAYHVPWVPVRFRSRGALVWEFAPCPVASRTTWPSLRSHQRAPKRGLTTLLSSLSWPRLSAGRSLPSIGGPTSQVG